MSRAGPTKKHGLKNIFSYGKRAGMDRFTLPNNGADLGPFYFLFEPVCFLYNFFPTCQRIIEMVALRTHLHVVFVVAVV